MNGYDPEKGLVMVPLDLNNEVIRPIERLEEKVAELKKDVNGHLDRHREDKLIEEERRAKMKRAVFWTASGSVPILLGLIAHFFGITL